MIHPVDIRVLPPQDVLITWSDQSRNVYAMRELRFLCPCAHCVDERTGKRIIELETISQTIAIQSMEPVGLYGVRFKWTDGHDTGIYGFSFLKTLSGKG